MPSSGGDGLCYTLMGGKKYAIFIQLSLFLNLSSGLYAPHQNVKILKRRTSGFEQGEVVLF